MTTPRKFGLEHPPALVRDVGRVVAEAAFLERSLAFLLDSLAVKGSGAVPLQTEQSIGAKLRRKTILAAESVGLDSESLAQLKACLARVDDLFELRNEIVHGHWVEYRRGVVTVEKFPPRTGEGAPYRREWPLQLLRALAVEMAKAQQELGTLHTRLVRARRAALVQIGKDNIVVRERWTPELRTPQK